MMATIGQPQVKACQVPESLTCMRWDIPFLQQRGISDFIAAAMAAIHGYPPTRVFPLRQSRVSPLLTTRCSLEPTGVEYSDPLTTVAHGRQPRETILDTRMLSIMQ